MASAFFYGTLMHPKILRRVIGHDGAELRIGAALLQDYTRHRVKGEDYPAIVPYAQSRTMLGEIDGEARCVRGSWVTGLSEEDVRLLDVFEGDEYTREAVRVQLLGRAVGLDEAAGVDGGMEAVETQTYVWCGGLFRLDAAAWAFDEFVAASAWRWIGPGSAARPDYAEVDRRRAMNGAIVRGSEAHVV